MYEEKPNFLIPLLIAFMLPILAAPRAIVFDFGDHMFR